MGTAHFYRATPAPLTVRDAALLTGLLLASLAGLLCPYSFLTHLSGAWVGRAWGAGLQGVWPVVVDSFVVGCGVCTCARD